MPKCFDEVMKILENMKSRGGIHNVNVNVVIDFIKEFGNVIVDLLNESLASEEAPDCYKFTIVTPIPKINNTTKATEMRPINKADVIDTALQTIVKSQRVKFVKDHDVLFQVQSAFKDDHSCETALNLEINK